MSSVSERIRTLARDGMAVADIARELGIRYQHAYKVCRDAGLLCVPAASKRSPAVAGPTTKRRLSVETLLSRGFTRAGKWSLDSHRLACPIGLPAECGVYAFAVGDGVVYVGLASRSLAQRLYFYGNPGPSQRTNVRLNARIRETLAEGIDVEIFYACPPSFEWNGFLISGAEGLEAGIIREYDLPWNMRGA